MARAGLSYAAVVHGAEITVPGRLPGTRRVLAETLRRAELVLANGPFPAGVAEMVAGRSLRVSVIPPGVDGERFRPLDPKEKAQLKEGLGIAAKDPLIVAVSRLVPRKGMDVLIAAAHLLARRIPRLTLLIVGEGRDHRRLAAMAAAARVRVILAGQSDHDRLPGLLGVGDIFAMLCRDRWGGMEQEGFGIVFLEAAACGVPQVAGASGGSSEAVEHGRSGLVVARPQDPAAAARALETLLVDDELRSRMGHYARHRALTEFSNERLAARLDDVLLEAEARAAGSV
ncbi:MAG: glycosyltransferase family 4 protein [Acidimicrobiales bacterium]